MMARSPNPPESYKKRTLEEARSLYGTHCNIEKQPSNQPVLKQLLKSPNVRRNPQSGRDLF